MSWEIDFEEMGKIIAKNEKHKTKNAWKEKEKKREKKLIKMIMWESTKKKNIE